DALDVDPWMPCGQLLDARLLIRQAVVAQVVVAEAVVRVRPSWTATPVADLDDDESELREPLRRRRRRERARHVLLLRTGVDVRDDRVLPVRIEVERLPQVAVDVGDAVRGL